MNVALYSCNRKSVDLVISEGRSGNREAQRPNLALLIRLSVASFFTRYLRLHRNPRSRDFFSGIVMTVS